MTHRQQASPLRGHIVGLAAALALLGCVTPSGAAQEPAEDDIKRIVGWVERFTLLPQGIPVKAKLDTGARTSSISAIDIERFERDGDRWVRFTLVLEDVDDVVHRERLERPLYRNVLIKDHDDASDRRPVVELDFCLDGRSHRAQFTLADRSGFIYPVLLGRRFLTDGFVIDPATSFEASSDCPEAEDDPGAEDDDVIDDEKQALRSAPPHAGRPIGEACGVGA